MSKARMELNWERMIELSIDSVKAQAYRNSSKAVDEQVCTMCGDLCAIKRSRDIFDHSGK